MGSAAENLTFDEIPSAAGLQLQARGLGPEVSRYQVLGSGCESLVAPVRWKGFGELWCVRRTAGPSTAFGASAKLRSG